MPFSAGLDRRRLFAFAILSLTLLFSWSFVVPSSQKVQAQDAPKAEEGEKPAERPNLFTHIVVSAGLFGPVLGLISLGLVALIVLLAMDLRLQTSVPPEFIEEFTDTVNKRKFKEAFELAKKDESF